MPPFLISVYLKKYCVRKYPRNVNNIPPKVLINILKIVKRYSPSLNRWKLSRLNVEKVVNEPSIPMKIKSLVSVDKM